MDHDYAVIVNKYRHLVVWYYLFQLMTYKQGTDNFYWKILKEISHYINETFMKNSINKLMNRINYKYTHKNYLLVPAVMEQDIDN